MQVALQFRLCPARADDDACAVEYVEEPVGGGKPVRTLLEVHHLLHVASAEFAGRCRTQTRHRVGDERDIAHPHGYLRCQVEAESTCEVIENVLDATALGLQVRRHLHQHQRRRDAVLVRDVGGIDAIAERLLVAEDQAGHPGDPLEARESCCIVQASVQRDGLQERAGDDRLRHGARHRCAAAPHPFDGPPAEQPAHFVAGEHAIALGCWYPRCAPICIGVVGDDDVGTVRGGLGKCQVHRAGLLRIGEGHGRKARVRLELLRYP